MKTSIFCLLLLCGTSLFAQSYESSVVQLKVTDEELLEALQTSTTLAVLDDFSDWATVITAGSITQIEKLYPAAYDESWDENEIALSLRAYFKLTSSASEQTLYSAIDTYEDQVTIDELSYIPVDFELYTPDDYGLTVGLDDYPQTNLDLINAEGAWDITHGSDDIKIAIVECCNGYNVSHEDLAANIYYVEPGIIDDETDPGATHGNSVAGCASAVTDNDIGISGLGFDCDLMLYQGNMGGGDSYDDILQAALDGANVINCSFISCTFSPSRQDVIDLVNSMNVVVVAGAGNGVAAAACYGGTCPGSDYNDYGYPASYDGVISVSSVSCNTNNEDNLELEPDYWHSFNDKVDVTAPGYHVVTTSLPGVDGDGYKWWANGTSFASPTVAGLAGLILSINPCLTPEEVTEIIKSTAFDNFSLYDNDDFIGCAGTGRIDAYEACLKAAGRVSYTVTGTETWTTFDMISDVLTIEDGASLTITSILYMAADAKIIVKRGGRLVVDGGTITNMCGDLWQGIEVYGIGSGTAHPTLSDVVTGAYPVDEYDHGVVYIKNGATISFARNAITTSKYDDFGNAAYRGGIVVAYNSSFINNRRSVEFMQFDYTPSNTDDDNISKFYGCDFQMNDDYPCEEDLYTHISMWDVDGIDIIGCTFEDYRSSCKNDAKAIYSIDATYNVASDYCGGALPCDPSISSFQGFYRAIEVDNANPRPRDVLVDKVVFSNNKRGILLSNVHNSLIMNNEFSVPDDETVNCYGIYAEDCTNYQIENNEFDVYGSYDEASPYCAGAYIVNNSNSYTQVYRNFFENLEAGIRVQENNLHLQIKCNTFTSEIRRHNVYVTNTGVLGQQGQCLGGGYTAEEKVQAPASNIFSQDCIGSEGDWKLYDGHGPMTYKRLNTGDYDLTCYTTGVSTYVTEDICSYSDGLSGEYACPSQLPSGGSGFRLDGSSIYEAHDVFIELQSVNQALSDLEELIENQEHELEYNYEEVSYDEDLAYLNQEKYFLMSEGVNLYTLENKIDSALLILNGELSDWAKQKRIEIYYLDGKYEDADIELLGLSNNSGNADFISLYSILIDVADNDRTIFDLTEGETESIIALASKQSPSGVAAENILTFLTGEDYPEVFDEEIDEEEIKNVSLSTNTIYVYPNPASNVINIDLTYYPSNDECTLIFYDLSGKKVFESNLVGGENNEIDFSALSNGIYFMSLVSNGTQFASDKIIKQ